jgi:hypothetical protein
MMTTAASAPINLRFIEAPMRGFARAHHADEIGVAPGVRPAATVDLGSENGL